MDYAMLGYKIDSTPLISGKRHLREFGEEGKKAGASTKKMGDDSKKGMSEAESAARKAAQGFDKLKASLDPAFASSQKYKAAQDAVSAALKSGAITQSEANRVLALAEKRYENAGRSAQLASRGMKLAAAAATAAVAAIASIGTAINTISQFETSMSRLGAISGATADQLASMRDIAKDLGSTTEFSAMQAADGLTFLSMAGFSASESMAAIPAVLDLATASGLGLAQAADTASNIMSGFGIQAENAAEVADVLAAAASRANTDVSQLGQAMSTVAPISAALDISLADTAASIGVLSDAGIQGARAGTALRGVLASLAGPTAEAEEVLSGLGLTIADVDPATNDLAVVMARLDAAGLSTADAMKIFGREASSGALVLVEGAKRLGEFGDELERVDGAAGDMADTMRDNLGGDIKGLQSAVSGLILSLGDAGLTAVIRGVVQAITGITRVVTLVVDGVAALGSAMGGLIFGADKAQIATDNLTLAMGDEISQAQKLIMALNDGRIMSIDVAGVKLEQAQAHLAAADAARQDAMAQIQLSDEYQRQQSIIDDNRRILQQYRDLEAQGETAGQFEADQIAELNRQLREAVNAQREMVSGAGEITSEYTETQAEIVRLQEAIANSKDGMVNLNGEVVTANDLTNRLSTTAGGINFDAGISSAQSLAQWLNISLSAAMQLSAITPQMSDEDAAMSQQVVPDASMREGQRSAVDNFARLTQSVRSPSGGGGGGGGGGGAGSTGQTEAQRELNKLMDEGESIMESLRTEQEKYNDSIAQADRLLEAGALSSEGYAQHVQNLSEEFAGIQFGPMIDGLTKISDGMIDAIANGDNLLDAFTNMLQEMLLEAIKADVASQISGMFGAATGGGSGASGAGGILGAIFGGARAEGGPVQAGVPYLVNENTANSEYMIPSKSGAVLNVSQGQKAMTDAISKSASSQPNIIVQPADVVVLDDPAKMSKYNKSPMGERDRQRADRRLNGA